LFLVYLNMKPPGAVVEFKAETSAPPAKEKTRSAMSFAEKLESAYALNALFGLLPLIYLVLNFQKIGFDLNLNLVVLIFLTCGLFLHSSPISYLSAVREAIGSTRGIILQFPLYAGISGMMVSSGLVDIVSQWFVSISTPATFPITTFLSAGLVNIFIPSGGGQWAVQGPIVMKAAQSLGADIPQTIMAFAWGDAWTNQIQPFWALPLLGIAGLTARDIMGYCVIWTIVSGITITALFTVLSFL
jgi:short-chain fatty acids transporter